MKKVSLMVVLFVLLGVNNGVYSADAIYKIKKYYMTQLKNFNYEGCVVYISGKYPDNVDTIFTCKKRDENTEKLMLYIPLWSLSTEPLELIKVRGKVGLFLDDKIYFSDWHRCQLGGVELVVLFENSKKEGVEIDFNKLATILSFIWTPSSKNM